MLLDGPQALRSYLIRNLIIEGFAFDAVMQDDEALEAFVRKAAIGVWHASCSARMGRMVTPWRSPTRRAAYVASKGCGW